MKVILIFFACVVICSCTSPPVKDAAKVPSCTEYACSMHPDKTSVEPGECPECHMALTPVDNKKENDTAIIENTGKQ